MRERLGMLLVEGEDGDISVQLFKDFVKAREVFRELKGRPGDASSRATFLTLNWPDECKMESRELPVLTDKSKEPDGWRVGVGPIHFEKDGEDGS